jgi:hypothetical protein
VHCRRQTPYPQRAPPAVIPLEMPSGECSRLLQLSNETRFRCERSHECERGVRGASWTIERTPRGRYAELGRSSAAGAGYVAGRHPEREIAKEQSGARPTAASPST